jgi:zinc protease
MNTRRSVTRIVSLALAGAVAALLVSGSSRPLTSAASGFSRTVSAQGAPPQQQESPTKGLVRKGKVPISDQIVRVTLPKAAEADLPNGLHLMVLEDHRLPQIQFAIYVPGAGGYYDPPDHAGLAQFTAALMREGTTTKTSEQISQQLEVIAANLTVGAGVSGLEATVNGSCLSEQVDRLLDMTADVLLHPSFTDEELTRYKQRTRTELIQLRANPGFLAQEMYQRAIYGVHPAARVSTTAEILDKTTRDALIAFHRAHYVPDRAAMAISGDISMADARKLVEAKLRAWAKSGATAAPIAEPAPISGSKIYFVSRPNSVQTYLIVGGQAIERTNPDYDMLQVMNRILGGGPTGRLFIHLREDKGYTYGIGSGLSAAMYRGDWSASTSVRTEVTDPALHDLLDEIRQMRDTPVADRELADARRAMVASFALSLESPATLLNYHVTRWRYRLPADYWDKYPDRINAATKAQVQAMAKKYLAPEHLQIVAVGDATKVTDVLKKLGDVEMYDADGKRVTATDVIKN